eukprot:PhM_4_TR6218/c0_g1_i1/m.34336
MLASAFLEARCKELENWEATLMQREKAVQQAEQHQHSQQHQGRRSIVTPSAAACSSSFDLDTQRAVLAQLQQAVESEALKVVQRKALLDLREEDLNKRESDLLRRESMLRTDTQRLAALIERQEKVVAARAKHNSTQMAVSAHPTPSSQEDLMMYDIKSPERVPPPPINTKSSPAVSPRPSTGTGGGNRRSGSVSPAKYAEGRIHEVTNAKEVKSFVEDLSDSEEETQEPHHPRGVAASPRFLASQHELREMEQQDWARMEREAEEEDDEEFDSTLEMLMETGALSHEDLIALMQQGLSVPDIIRQLQTDNEVVEIPDGDDFDGEEYEEQEYDEEGQEGDDDDDGLVRPTVLFHPHGEKGGKDFSSSSSDDDEYDF